MDKTIEERIWDMAVDIGNNCVDFNGREVDFCYIEDGLRQIATEQRDIDIEKAIKVHCSLCTFKKCCEESKEHNCFEIEEIKKAMMEE